MLPGCASLRVITVGALLVGLLELGLRVHCLVEHVRLQRGKLGRRVSMSAKRVGVRVCARIRPPHKKEERGPIQFLPASPMKGLPSERVQVRNLEFCLDRIFDDDSQDAIYRACCEPSVSSVVDGLNATILAFGQARACRTGP